MPETQIYSENNIFYYIEVIKKWKKFIIINTIVVTIIASVVAFILPPWYYSVASLKPSENTSLSLFSAVLGSKGLSSIGKNLNIGGLQYSDLDYYKSLLTSRKVMLQMIKKFDLMKVYDQKFVYRTIDELIANSDFQIDSKSNMFLIGLYDKDPNRAQAMVSEYLLLLEQSLREFSDVDLKFNRQFIEKRFNQNQKDLDAASDSLKNFQKKYGVIIPEEQFVSTIKATAEIEAQKLFMQSQLASYQSNLGSDAPAVNSLKIQIKTLSDKLKELKVKENSSKDSNLFITFKSAPDLINKYMHIYRNVEIQTKLMEIVYPLYEQAKMEETKNAPAFVIIDQPFYPEYKVKPKRATIILSGFVISISVSFFGIFIMEYLKKLKKNKLV